MAFALKEMDADSIPINFLHPIKGTKFGSMDDLTPMKCLKNRSIIPINQSYERNSYCWRKRGQLTFVTAISIKSGEFNICR